MAIDNMTGQTYTMADPSLSAGHIAGGPDPYRNYEAARSSFFVLNLDPAQFDNLLKMDANVSQADAQAADKIDSATFSESIRLNVTKCSIPKFTVGTQEYRRGNDVVKFATVPTWTEGSLTVDDIVGLDTKSLLMSWLYLAYNPNTRMAGRMRDYKKKAQLIEYTQDYAPIRVWDIEGIFVTGVEQADFDRSATDDKRELTATFVFDRATMNFNL